MSQFVITFVGIVMFMSMPIGGVQDARHVVIPRFEREAEVVSPGRVPVKIPAHIPYIAFTTESCGDLPCADLSEWPDAPIHFKRGEVKWAYVPVTGFHLSVKDSQNPLRIHPTVNALMPRLTEYCPGLVLPEAFSTDDTPHPRKATTIDVATGLLSARGNVSLDKAIFSDWEVTVPDDLIIEATPYGGGPTRRLKLKKGPNPNATPVEIGNAPESYIRNPDSQHHDTVPNHFLVYYTSPQLPPDSNDAPYVTPCFRRPGPHGLAEPVPGLRAAPDKLPSADCSNTNYP